MTRRVRLHLIIQYASDIKESLEGNDAWEGLLAYSVRYDGDVAKELWTAVFHDANRLLDLVGDHKDSTTEWQPIETAPENTVVLTRVGDEDCKGLPLKRKGRLWWFADGSMYVYYTPTHWRAKN